MNNIPMKYTQEHIMKRAEYHGLLLFFSINFNLTGFELRKAAADEMRKFN